MTATRGHAPSQGRVPKIRVTINGVRMTALIDTGSSVTLLKRDTALELTEKGCAMAKCDKSISTLSDSGVRISEKMWIEIDTAAGKNGAYALVYATNRFSGNILIGSDLLGNLNATIDYEKGGVVIAGKLHPFCNTNKVTECALAVRELEQSDHIATVAQTTRIAGMTAVVLELHTASALEGETVAVVPLQKYDGMIASTVCVVRQQLVQVVVMNSGSGSILLRCGAKIALAHKLHVEEEAEEAQVLCLNEEDGSADDLLALKIDSVDVSHLDEPTGAALKELLWRYRGAVTASDTDIGHVRGVEHTIRVTDDRPIRVPQWRLPHSTKQILEDHVAKMVKAGVIQPSDSAWSSPVVMVKKPDGVSYRVCIDYRRLNAVTIKESYPIPNITESVESASGHQLYSVIDSASAYHQIPLSKQSRKYTSFRTDSGCWEYLRLPMGACNSSFVYQKTACAILKRHLGLGRYCQCFQDDICLYSDSVQEHMTRLEEILVDLQTAGMKVGLKKCHFLRPEVKFLGHIISKSGIRPDPAKVEAMRRFPRPNTARKIRAFLGAVGYYKRFIPQLSRIAIPLTNLTKKNCRFKWTPEHELAFEELKKLMTEAPVLKPPDFSKTFRLHTDASKRAIGAVLNQEHDGQEYPVAYYSRKLRGTELNYGVSEIEALGVVDSVKNFHPYLAGYHFKVITDHTALKYIFKHKNSTNARLARWALSLSQYDYEIIYKEGATHFVPDALSRNPEDDSTSS